MGFRPSQTDFDLWIRPRSYHYEYIATHVNDILVFSKNPMSFLEEVQTKFKLQGIGMPEYYLGGNVHSTKDVDGTIEANNDMQEHHLSSKWLKEGVKNAFSARTYIKNCMKKLETMMGVEFFFSLKPQWLKHHILKQMIVQY